MNPVTGLYRFFQTKKWLLLALVFIAAGLMVVPALKLEQENDISRFLPKTKKIERINKALEEMKLRDKTVINLYLKDTSKTEPLLLMEMADLIADSINNHFDSSWISELRYRQSEDAFAEIYDLYAAHLPVFTEDAQYQRIEAIMNPDSMDQLMGNHYRNLISPMGMFTGKYLGTDPLNLTSLAVKKLQGLQLDEKITVNDGYFFSEDSKNLLLFLTPAFKSSQGDKSAKLVSYLYQLRKQINKSSKGAVSMEFYGGPAVSVANANCIKQDTRWLTIISISCIALLLVFYFRDWKSMLLLMLPVVFGALFALAAVYLLKGSISVIAIGAGSVVFGISINYSLHVLTHFKHYQNAEVVIKDLLSPMLMGCVTTVAAFFSLVFVKSEALHDFGLFAGFCLVGTFLFCFLVLPHLLNWVSGKNNAHGNFIDRISEWQPHRNKWIVISVILGALVLGYFSSDVTFEKDMRKLSYESPELQKWHYNLDQINNYTQQSVFISVSDSNREKALLKNEAIAKRLAKTKAEHNKLQYSSLAGIMLPESVQEERIAKWTAFWTVERKDRIRTLINQSAQKFGFSDDAFSAFFTSLNTTPQKLNAEEIQQFQNLVASGMMQSENGTTTIYSVVKTPTEVKNSLYEFWANDDMVTVFDNARITSLFAEAVASDFQLILLMTAGLVFGFMLLSRGRIETTVINFLPMVVSWLCILGFMALAGIPFNLINIIISTFIFGLGDDYSIFILDGLETEYKYGNKLLSSYKSAILLSAITTMIGLGALLFAEHPALKSIATIGVLGILVVIIVSFVIQPLLYNWMILNRSKRGLPPYNALNMLITLVGFGVFTLGSISLTISGLVLFYIIPISKTKKRLAFHKMLMHLNRVILGIFVNVKKNIITTEDIPVSKQAIMIANHQSHIDLALIMQLHPKLIIFTNDWVWNSPFYGKIVKMADFYPASKGYEQAAFDLKPLIDEGYSVMIFPEGTRSIDGNIHRFHKGAFYLQEKLGLDILPVLIHGAGDCVTKGDFHFKQGRLTVKILPRISADNTTPGLSYKDRCKWTNQYMRNEYALLKQECETESYFKSRLIANYIYKGPVLEWYTRVKIGMESYYQMFNQILPKTGTITDVGCGYGYLAYMLKYTSPERSIFAMDYDEDKISVAQNNYSNRKLGISFEAADINEYAVNPSDGIVALDILHYLTPEQQVNTINKLMNALNPKGILIIRDANVDYKKKHLFTRYTEFFSTKSGFNKTKPQGLSFLSSGLIEKTVAQNGNFTCEIIDNTRYLSNLVYIIKPKADI